jgi:polyferredoxin
LGTPPLRRDGLVSHILWDVPPSAGMQEIGKTLIIFGIILLGLGLLLTFAQKIPFLGRLPGDILIQKKNFTFYFPLVTSILISVILSLVFWLWSRR